jgi:hypothetical protein
MPFGRVRHLLYNLFRFGSFNVDGSRQYLIYAIFQLELYAWKTVTRRDSNQHRITHRAGIPSQHGIGLSQVRGLDFHKTMERLAILYHLR